MTLVAAYRSHGIPMLTGDFLITSPEVPDSTSPDVVCKKVVKITDNLVVGWTGSLITAKSVLGNMRERVPADGVASKDWLEDCLTSYEEDDFKPLDVRLVGWLIDNEDYCFSWNSEYPGTVFYGDPMIDGSGKNLYKHLFPDSNPSPSRLSHEENFGLAIQYSLATVSQMMSEEILHDGKFRPLGVGYAYETLYLGTNGFQYINDVLYCVLSASFNEDWTLNQMRAEPDFYKYSSFQEHSVIIILHGDDKGITTTPRIISPPYYVSEDVKNQVAHDVSSLMNSGGGLAYGQCCCFIKMSCPNYPDLLVEHTIYANQDPNAQLGVNVFEDGSLIAYATSSILELVYKRIRQGGMGYFSLRGTEVTNVIL